MEAKDVFDQYEQELFTRVVAVAEKEGKPVHLLVVPGTSVFDTIVGTAQRLNSSAIVSGLSQQLTADEQGKFTGDAWERLPEPRPEMVLKIVAPNGTETEYVLGPHTPRLRPEDLALIHATWLKLTARPALAKLHHYHVVALAMRELQREVDGDRGNELLKTLEAELRNGNSG
jgi:hypothetical protein